MGDRDRDRGRGHLEEDKVLKRYMFNQTLFDGE